MMVPPAEGMPGRAQVPSGAAQPSIAVLLPFQTQACVWREPIRCPISCVNTSTVQE